MYTYGMFFKLSHFVNVSARNMNTKRNEGESKRLHTLLVMLWNKEIFYRHSFSTIIKYAIQEDPRNSIRTGTEWNTSVPGLWWRFWYNGQKIKAVQKNNAAQFEASREVDLEVNTEKYMYVHASMSRHQNAGQNRDLMRANKFSKMWQSLNMWE